ncbi:MAG: glycosyltransferase family 39 protein, partial [Actinomycetota bacterium]|nr:glycosyltransferase family 39 protein [Actinomycetota bacterium]
MSEEPDGPARGDAAVGPEATAAPERSPDELAAPSGGRPFGPRDALLIFGIALALRLVHLWCVRDMPFVEVPIVDAKAYDEWGQRIAAGDWWGDTVFYQAPLYPYFLGTFYAVFGHSLAGVHALQMAMGAASCVLLALAAWALFGDRAVALATGIAVAVYPPAIFFDGLIGKQGLGLLLLSGLLWLLLRQQREARRGELVAAGALLGLLCLTRENALALVPALVPWLAWRFWPEGLPRVGLVLALFAAGLALVLVPVGLRNLAVGDTFALTTSQMGPNFYIGNHSGASGLYEPLLPGRQTPVFEASDAELLAERELGRELTRGEVSDYWMAKGLAFVRDEPVAWLGLMVRKTVLTWGAFEVPDVEDVYVFADWSPIVRFGLPVYHFGVLAGLAAAGAVFAWP